MQKSRIISSVGVTMAAMVLMTSGVAFAQKVSADYNKSTNFAAYKTYTWIKEPKSSDPLTRQRIIDEVNGALASKGLQPVTDNPDLAIAVHSATKEEKSLDTFYNGFGGGWRWGGGFGNLTTRVETYEVGTLVIDIFDARTKEALWRGTSTKTLSDNPQKNAASLNKAIDKMFSKFPPSNSRASR
jgi:hypothetical protein